MPDRIGIVVQRYGLEINGGAEYHARLIAEKLCKFVAVEIFTTAAIDYVTWANHWEIGRDMVNGIVVNRFPVERPRDPRMFGEWQSRVFQEEHSRADEIRWLEEEGPLVPSLIRELERRDCEFDYYVFFSYRYYHSYMGIRRFPRKSILVPTAEHDQVIYLRLFRSFFRLPAAIVYNSPEERALICRLADNSGVPGDVVGVGSNIPARVHPDVTRRKYGIGGKYAIYIGRLDENKGVPELLRFFPRFLKETGCDLDLVLVGKSVIPVPAHPNIRHVGFLFDQEKFDLLAGAEFLIIPSQYESLCMVVLEAWALGKPVVANGRTDVLRGQCQRSHAGLWYTDYEEFKEAVSLLAADGKLREKLGRNGRAFFYAHYDWDVIEKKYLAIFNVLDSSLR